MPAKSNGLSAFFEGLRAPVPAAAAIVRRPAWLALSALPVLCGFVAVLATGALLWRHGPALLERLWSRPESAVLAALWGVAAVGLWLAGTFAAGLLVSRVALAPVLELLAGMVIDDLLGDRAPREGFARRPFWQTLLPGIGRALGRVVIYLAVLGLVSLIGLVPGLGLVAGPLALIWTAAWLLADTLTNALVWVGEGRSGDVVRCIRRDPLRHLGMASSLALLALVPFAGLLLAPVGVVAAARLVARDWSEPDFRGTAGAALQSDA